MNPLRSCPNCGKRFTQTDWEKGNHECGEDDYCRNCGCRIAKGAFLCGECACEEDVID